MHYWLQQLQQKRWEYSNTRGSGQRDSWSSPTLAYPPTGLVGKDNGRHTHTHTCTVWTFIYTALYCHIQAPAKSKHLYLDGLIFTQVELFCCQRSTEQKKWVHIYSIWGVFYCNACTETKVLLYVLCAVLTIAVKSQASATDNTNTDMSQHNMCSLYQLQCWPFMKLDRLVTWFDWHRNIFLR